MGKGENNDVRVHIEEECDSQTVQKLLNEEATSDKNNNNGLNGQLTIAIDPEKADAEAAAAEFAEVLEKKPRFTLFGYRVSQIKWTNLTWLIFIHALAIVAYVHCSLYPVKFWTVFWTVSLSIFGGMGVSVGAHRLWAHRAFKAHWLLKLFLMLGETVSMNGGCYSYARDHRCHHKFVDTNGDPKNAKRGFFFAHIGWWMLKKHPEVLRMGKKLNTKDLDDEWIIRFQKRFFIPLFLIFGIILPTIVPYYVWDEDLLTSFYTCCVLRTVIVLHHLFTVNSVAHIWGFRPYNLYIGPAESRLTNYLAMGEGSHNYHHTFPQDYANCEKLWWEVFNPSTLFVDIAALLGLAHDLKKPSVEVVRGVVNRKGDPNYFERKLFRNKSMRTRILRGLNDWSMGALVAGWAIYPPIIFKVLTDRPVFVF